MQVDKIIEQFGSRAALADELKTSWQVVNYWLKINKIPRWWIKKIKLCAFELDIELKKEWFK